MKTKRNTIQRELVLAAVHRMHTHPTADEIYFEVQKEHPAISKGTVYRNLNLLAETGEIRRVALPEGADRFDFKREPHYHIRCTNCGRVYDVDMPYQQELCSQITELHGFVVKSHDIVFQGVCPECNKLK